MRRFIAAAIASLALVAFTAGSAGAAQPGAECGAPGATMSPPGFNTDGFASAETVYAGSPGTPSAANGNSHAVSQYDIACVNYTSAHGG